MSESCRRGHKSFCFQCGETSCEKFQPEPPEWLEKLREDDELMEQIVNAVKGTGEDNKA